MTLEHLRGHKFIRSHVRVEETEKPSCPRLSKPVSNTALGSSPLFLHINRHIHLGAWVL